jgi:hydroxymethylbilane synthase
MGGIGVFTKEIQQALIARAVDIAVHSLKDLPTANNDGICLAAVPSREDVADGVIAPIFKTIGGLPLEARVGTSSPRRRAQLLLLRPDLRVESLRGNVETRLHQALDGKLDAILLALAGLKRLGLEGHITERLDPLKFLPAVGQGALGIECRRDDLTTIALLKRLDDPITRRAVVAERAVLAGLQGGCNLPIGAWARDLTDDLAIRNRAALAIDAAVFDYDGRKQVRIALSGDIEMSESLGFRAAESLKNNGGTELLADKAMSSRNP